MNPRTRWLIVAAFIAPTVLAAVGIETSLRTARKAEETAARVAVEGQVTVSRDCVKSWETYDGSREAVRVSIEGVVNLAFQTMNIRPEREAEIRQLVVPVVADATRELAAPTCSRDAAEARLDQLTEGD